MSSCKCKETECEECPEWIFTLADLIMCMMGLFVILWCLKPGADEAFNKDQKNPELIKVLARIREAFGYIPDPNSSDPIDLELLGKKIQELPAMKGPGQGGKTDERPEGANGSHNQVTDIRAGNRAVVGSRVRFNPGQTALTPDGERILNEILELIKGHRNIFMVKGHVSLDDLGENATPQQRMDLSLKRAQVVSEYLVAHGMKPDTLRVIGCSTFEPIIEGAASTQDREPNRRVEIQSLDQLVQEFQDSSKEPAKPLNPSPPATNPVPASEALRH